MHNPNAEEVVLDSLLKLHSLCKLISSQFGEIYRRKSKIDDEIRRHFELTSGLWLGI